MVVCTGPFSNAAGPADVVGGQGEDGADRLEPGQPTMMPPGFGRLDHVADVDQADAGDAVEGCAQRGEVEFGLGVLIAA